MLALGNYGGRVMLVDDATGEERWSVPAHSIGDTAVAMSPDGRFVASVGRYDERWKLWDAASGALHREGACGTGACICWARGGALEGTGACICWTRGEALAMGHHPRLGAGSPLLQLDVDVFRKILDHATLQVRRPVVARTHGPLSVAFSPCGERLATHQGDAVIVWDTQTGQAQQRMPVMRVMRWREYANVGTGDSVTFSADGARLVCGPQTPSSLPLLLWAKGAPGQTRRSGMKLGGPRRRGRRGAVTWVELGSMDAINAQPDEYAVTWVNFSPTDNGKLAIAGSAEGDRGIQVLDVGRGKIIRKLEGCFRIAEFSPDGQAIATVNDVRGTNALYRYVKVVDANSGEVRCTMARHMHTDEVTAISWSVSLTPNPKPQTLNSKPLTLNPEH